MSSTGLVLEELALALLVEDAVFAEAAPYHLRLQRLLLAALFIPPSDTK